MQTAAATGRTPSGYVGKQTSNIVNLRFQNREGLSRPLNNFHACRVNKDHQWSVGT